MPALPRPLRGIVPPMVTPLRSPTELDPDGIARVVDHILSAPIAALFILGTTGEGPLLSGNVQRECIRQVMRCVNGRVPVLVGITHASLPESLDLARYAAEQGVSAVVAAPIYYFRPNKGELARWVDRLANESPLPVFLYNMPAFTKISIPLEVVQGAMAHRNIIGLKDSSGDMGYLHAARRLVMERSDWSLLVGPEHLTAEFVLFGGNGGVNGGANIRPQLFVDLYEAAHRLDHAKVTRLQEQVLRLGKLYTLGDSEVTVIQGTKAALAELGICQNILADPHGSLNPANRESVRRILAES